MTDLKYHLIWVTKYRYKILRGDVAERARERSRLRAVRFEEIRGRLRVRHDEPLAMYGATDEASRRTLLEQLALFHADIAMLHRDAAGYRLSALSRLPPAVADGAPAGAAARIVHWDLGRRILDLLEPRA